MSEPSPEPAGFGIRAAARLIDYGPTLLAAIGAGVMLAFVGGILSTMTANAGRDVYAALIKDRLLNQISVLLGSILYHAFSESVGGASLGKRLLGLEVVRADDLQPASLMQTWKRNLAFVVDGFFFGLVAYRVMEGSEIKQRIGDNWGKTRVVRRRSLPPALRRPTSIFVFALLGALAIAAEIITVVHIGTYWLAS